MWSAITRQRLVLGIFAASQFAGGLQQRLNRSILVAVYALHDRGNTPSPMPVSTEGFAAAFLTVRLTIELHKYVVPDFDEGITVLSADPEAPP